MVFPDGGVAVSVKELLLPTLPVNEVEPVHVGPAERNDVEASKRSRLMVPAKVSVLPEVE